MAALMLTRTRPSKQMGAIRDRALGWSAFLWNQSRFHGVARPFRSVRVSPSTFERKLKAPFPWFLPVGTIRGGSWDLETIPLSDSLKIRGVRERFEKGLGWRDTCLFRERYEPKLRTGQKVVGFGSPQELETFYKHSIDKLFERIRHRGFQEATWISGIGPMYAYVGRDGQFYWGQEGNHRLAIAQVLQVPTIPVMVHMRHSDWQRVRSEIARHGNAELPARLAEHADLADLLDAKEASEARP